LFVRIFLLHVSTNYLYGILLHYEIGCKASSGSVMEVNLTLALPVSVATTNEAFEGGCNQFIGLPLKPPLCET